MNKEWLIRLRDCDNVNVLIATYFAENPKQQLEVFSYCQENRLPIKCPNKILKSDKNYKYRNKEGLIYDVEVIFGDIDSYCTIDVWLEEITEIV